MALQKRANQEQLLPGQAAAQKQGLGFYLSIKFGYKIAAPYIATANSTPRIPLGRR